MCVHVCVCAPMLTHSQTLTHSNTTTHTHSHTQTHSLTQTQPHAYPPTHSRTSGLRIGSRRKAPTPASDANSPLSSLRLERNVACVFTILKALQIGTPSARWCKGEEWERGQQDELSQHRKELDRTRALACTHTRAH